MVYNKLRTNIIFRVLLLLITCILISLVFFRMQDMIILVNLFILLILQVIVLIRYLNKTNDIIAGFFMAVENDDTSLNYIRKNRDREFRKLYESMNRLNEKVKAARLENYRQHQFFRAVTEQVKTGLLVFDREGNIELCNSTAQSLLGVSRLHTFQALDNKHPHLTAILRSLKPSQTRVAGITSGDTVRQLSLHASEYKIFEKTLKLVSVQDIKNELEDRELESW